MPESVKEPVGLMSNRVFLSIFGIGALQSVARWLELLALGVYVFDVTDSPFLVALITLLRVAPLALFGSLFGALTSRFARRRVYIIGLICMIAVSLIMAWLSWTGRVTVWQLCLASFLGGLFWVLDFPVRRTLMGEAVPARMLGRAMGLDTIANNGTRMIGPLLGGAFLQVVGLYGAFLLSVLFYSLCLIVTLSLSIGKTAVGGQPGSIFGEMRLGLRTVMADRVLLSVLLVTVVYNLFGFPTLSMVPVIGRDVMALSASMVGSLAAMEGVGAMIGGVMIVFFGRMRWFRKIYVFGLALCMGFGLMWATVGEPLPAGFALVIVGIGASGFSAMQTTILILNSDIKDRSRVMGLLSVCVGTALIGFAQVGIVANLLGPAKAVVLSSVTGLIVLFLMWLKWPEIIAPQSHAEAEGD